MILGDEGTKFKTLQLKRTQAESNPKQKIFDVYRHNLGELVKALKYLTKEKIWMYRISSDMFPLADHEEFEHYWKEFCDKDYLWLEARESVQNYLRDGGRLSTHPDQFCVISSNNEEVNKKGIKNLEYHAKMFDMLHIPQNFFCPINIHISNGKLGEIAAHNAIRNFALLSHSVTSRLVFENEDKSFWQYQNIAKYFPNVPITLDYHHWWINGEGSEEEAHDFCVSTWKGITPLFHYSEGKDHALDRAHSDYVSSLPNYKNVDIELEAKQKNLAVLRMRVA